MRVAFVVSGIPVPKQSYRSLKGGGGYTPARVKAWQELVAQEAALAMRGKEIHDGPCEVEIDFYLPDHKRRDLDNLSKAVLDACNGIVYKDDNKITTLILHKHFTAREYGITFYFTG